MKHVTQAAARLDEISFGASTAQLHAQCAEGSIEGICVEPGLVVAAPEDLGAGLAGAHLLGVLVKV